MTHEEMEEVEAKLIAEQKALQDLKVGIDGLGREIRASQKFVRSAYRKLDVLDQKLAECRRVEQCLALGICPGCGKHMSDGIHRTVFLGKGLNRKVKHECQPAAPEATR